jgi:hypothetical protein
MSSKAHRIAYINNGTNRILTVFTDADPIEGKSYDLSLGVELSVDISGNITISVGNFSDFSNAISNSTIRFEAPNSQNNYYEGEIWGGYLDFRKQEEPETPHNKSNVRFINNSDPSLATHDKFQQIGVKGDFYISVIGVDDIRFRAGIPNQSQFHYMNKHKLYLKLTPQGANIQELQVLYKASPVQTP